MGVALVERARRSCELDRHASIPALAPAAERVSSLEARLVAAVQAQAIRGLLAASSSLKVHQVADVGARHDQRTHRRTAKSAES